MAKRDKAAEWKPPEFDEVEYMKKEIQAAKATIIVVLWTLPAAALSFGLTLAGIAVVAGAVGLGMMFLLKWIFPLLKVDVSEYKRKDWIGHGLTFFFSWLAFWILLLNPPFADLTSPVILGIAVAGGGSWPGCPSDPPLPDGGRVFNVSAADNVAISEVTVTIDAGSPVTLIRVGVTLWQGPVTIPVATQGRATVAVKDTAGHASYCVFNFT